MKHITKVSIEKAQQGPCTSNNLDGISAGLQGSDPLACIGALLLEALSGNKNKGGTAA